MISLQTIIVETHKNMFMSILINKQNIDKFKLKGYFLLQLMGYIKDQQCGLNIVKHADASCCTSHLTN